MEGKWEWIFQPYFLSKDMEGMKIRVKNTMF